MKKRINDSEIEKAKSSTRVMAIIISSCILLLIILAAYIGYLYEKGEIFKTDDGKYIINEKITDKKIIKNKATKIDTNNTNVVELWNYVKVSTNPCKDGSYTDKEKVKVTKLNDTCKYSLASNIYNKYVTYDSDENITSVKENIVKNSYETLFEVGNYSRQDTIPYTNMDDLMYNVDNKYYFKNGKAEVQDNSLRIYESIISVVKEDKNLYITSDALYYEKVNKYICKDINCEVVVQELSKDKDYNDEYFELYLDSKKEKLSKYTYHFKLNDAGFYKYIGYEKTN